MDEVSVALVRIPSVVCKATRLTQSKKEGGAKCARQTETGVKERGEEKNKEKTRRGNRSRGDGKKSNVKTYRHSSWLE